MMHGNENDGVANRNPHEPKVIKPFKTKIQILEFRMVRLSAVLMAWPFTSIHCHGIGENLC